jgi:hypothetical protein
MLAMPFQSTLGLQAVITARDFRKKTWTRDERDGEGGTCRSEERPAHSRASAKWVRGAWHHAYKKARNFVRVGGWVSWWRALLPEIEGKYPPVVVLPYE